MQRDGVCTIHRGRDLMTADKTLECWMIETVAVLVGFDLFDEGITIRNFHVRGFDLPKAHGA